MDRKAIARRLLRLARALLAAANTGKPANLANKFWRTRRGVEGFESKGGAFGVVNDAGTHALSQDGESLSVWRTKRTAAEIAQHGLPKYKWVRIYDSPKEATRGRGAHVAFADLDKAEAYTKEVAALLRKKKGELGIRSFRQGYKGTGSQRAVRQIWLRFKNGAVIDVWIHPGGVAYGGVVGIHPSGVRRGPDPSSRKTTNNARKTADAVADDLKEWMEV